jgi:1-acyl-sn-glycerol-3-phosphate acyltransferase
MNRSLKRSLRVVARSLWLAGELVLALIKFVALIAAHAGIPDRTTRARWLQHVCRRALRVFHLELRVTGAIPSSGLLVCNHLGYLDIIVLGATTPCVFVSKCEVRRWPVFGWFASLAGTLFLRRDKRSDVARLTREMRRLLDTGALVVLFPEGTTSDGRDVLPFKSSLLEPATRQRHSLSAGFIEYALNDGCVAEEVCYWRDMTLAPHLLNLLGKRGLEARLYFTELRQASPDRKQLARQLHSEVVRLKEAFSV